MLGRLLAGLLVGLLVGGLVAAGFVEGIHVLSFGSGSAGAALAYLAAALTGVLTGAVAGKPFWASGAKIEAGLKAFFGALLGAALMFALRQWASSVVIPATSFTPDHLPAGDLPAVSLPLLAAVLGAFFGVDNTGGAADEKADHKRVATAPDTPTAKARVSADGEVAEPASSAAKRAKR